MPSLLYLSLSLSLLSDVTSWSDVRVRFPPLSLSLLWLFGVRRLPLLPSSSLRRVVLSLSLSRLSGVTSFVGYLCPLRLYCVNSSGDRHYNSHRGSVHVPIGKLDAFPQPGPVGIVDARTLLGIVGAQAKLLCVCCNDANMVLASGSSRDPTRRPEEENDKGKFCNGGMHWSVHGCNFVT